MDSKDEITLRHLVDARFVALEREMELRFKALEREMNLELRSSATALSKANDALGYRLELLNEFRSAMGDQAKNFATRSEVHNLRETNELQFRAISKQLYLVVGALVALQALLQFFL